MEVYDPILLVQTKLFTMKNATMYLVYPALNSQDSYVLGYAATSQFFIRDWLYGGDKTLFKLPPLCFLIFCGCDRRGCQQFQKRVSIDPFGNQLAAIKQAIEFYTNFRVQFRSSEATSSANDHNKQRAVTPYNFRNRTLHTQNYCLSSNPLSSPSTF